MCIGACAARSTVQLVLIARPFAGQKRWPHGPGCTTHNDASRADAQKVVQLLLPSRLLAIVRGLLQACSRYLTAGLCRVKLALFAMTSLKAQVSEREATAIRKRLVTWAREKNPACAECGRANPTWASVNLGVLVCLECAGRHRSLGVHISKMHSISLDTVLPEEARFLISMSNELANRWWEARLDPGEKVRLRGSPGFVEQKYSLRKWVLQDASIPVPSKDTVPQSHPWWADSAPAAASAPSSVLAAPRDTATRAASAAQPPRPRPAVPPPSRSAAAVAPSPAPRAPPPTDLIDFGALSIDSAPPAAAAPAAPPTATAASQAADPFASEPVAFPDPFAAPAPTAQPATSHQRAASSPADPFAASHTPTPSHPPHVRPSRTPT